MVSASALALGRHDREDERRAPAHLLRAAVPVRGDDAVALVRVQAHVLAPRVLVHHRRRRLHPLPVLRRRQGHARGDPEAPAAQDRHRRGLLLAAEGPRGRQQGRRERDDRARARLRHRPHGLRRHPHVLLGRQDLQQVLVVHDDGHQGARDAATTTTRARATATATATVSRYVHLRAHARARAARLSVSLSPRVAPRRR